jgi:NADH dehydrogenase
MATEHAGPPLAHPPSRTPAPRASVHRRTDQHSLVNFGLPKKLLASITLLGGVVLFFGASLAGVFLANYELSARAVLEWGAPLMVMQETSPVLFYGVLAAHAMALATVCMVARFLFDRVALPRGARRALMSLTLVFGLLELLAWLLLPYAGFAKHALGPLLGLTTAFLLYLVGRPLRDMWVFTRWKNRSGEKKRVVIVGGGFAGLYAAIEIDRRLGYHDDLEVTVLDKKNYFLFPPLLPSVAAGAIETRQITYPFRRIFEATNVAFRKGAVFDIDLERKVVSSRVDIDEDPVTGKVNLIECQTPYDFLVLAPGSETNTFGTKGVVEHAFFMRELGDATSVRNHMIDCFERAAREDSEGRRRELLRFVIVGAGPTGVELASEVRDLIEHILFRRYPEVHTEDVEVVLIQSAPQILPGWHEGVVERATHQLGRLNIRLLLKRRVLGVDAFSVTLDGGERIETRTCVWCAGVKPSGLLARTTLPRDKSGRVPVGPDLRVPERPEVFVLGDAAYLEHKGKPLPPLGQVAFQQGTHAGVNIIRTVRGKRTKVFKYFNYGSLVSVGEHFAAIDLMGVRTSGFIAWIVWRTLYLMKLVGFGNRVRVVLDWTLDLLIERSISQITVTRQDLSADSIAAETAKAARSAPAGSPAAVQ